MAIDPEIQKMLTAYQASGPNPEGGIPNALYQYAQSNPGALIDRSGQNLQTTDPMFNFYNPTQGQTPGVDWFNTDDRNLPAELSTQSSSNGGSFNTPGLPTDPSATPSFGGSFGGKSLPGVNFTKPAGVDFTGMTQAPTGNIESLGFLQPFPTGSPTSTPAPTTSAPTPQSTPGTGTTSASGLDLAPILNQYGLGSQQLTNMALPAIQSILGNMNNGLPNNVLSALRSQSTSGIPGQYEDAARALRSNLLRSGAIGAGELPASGADLLRLFSPLEQARNEAVTGANRSTIMANYDAQQKNQDRGLQAVDSLLQGQGLINQVLNAGIQSGTQLKLEDMDAMTRIRLAQMGIDSNEKLGKLQSDTQLALGNLDADTRKWVASLDTDTQKWTSTLSAETQKSIAQWSNANNIDVTKLNNQNRIDVAKIENAPGSFKDILLGSLLSTVTSGGGSSIIGKGISALLNVFSGGKKSDGTSAKPGDPEFVGPVQTAVKETITGAGSKIGSLGGKAVTKIGDGASAAIGFLMNNPWTIAIAGGIAATTLWLKSQAHWEANTWVQGYQNKFDKSMGDINQQFWDLAASGKLTKEQAQAIRDASEGMITTYLGQRETFKGQGKDEALVAGQALKSFEHWYGPDGSSFLSAMDGVIAGLA